MIEFREDDIEGYVWLRDRSPIPIAAGEGEADGEHSDRRRIKADPDAPFAGLAHRVFTVPVPGSEASRDARDLADAAAN